MVCEKNLLNRSLLLTVNMSTFIVVYYTFLPKHYITWAQHRHFLGVNTSSLSCSVHRVHQPTVVLSRVQSLKEKTVQKELENADNSVFQSQLTKQGGKIGSFFCWNANITFCSKSGHYKSDIYDTSFPQVEVWIYSLVEKKNLITKLLAVYLSS